MSHYKIIFAGPVGAGKTTAVTAASDIPPVRTDASASDEVRDLKPNTTVALDYGAMKLADGSTIHLYGTPGQQRFDFIWRGLNWGEWRTLCNQGAGRRCSDRSFDQPLGGKDKRTGMPIWQAWRFSWCFIIKGEVIEGSIMIRVV